MSKPIDQRIVDGVKGQIDLITSDTREGKIRGGRYLMAAGLAAGLLFWGFSQVPKNTNKRKTDNKIENLILEKNYDGARRVLDKAIKKKEITSSSAEYYDQKLDREDFFKEVQRLYAEGTYEERQKLLWTVEEQPFLTKMDEETIKDKLGTPHTEEQLFTKIATSNDNSQISLANSFLLLFPDSEYKKEVVEMKLREQYNNLTESIGAKEASKEITKNIYALTETYRTYGRNGELKDMVDIDTLQASLEQYVESDLFLIPTTKNDSQLEEGDIVMILNEKGAQHSRLNDTDYYDRIAQYKDGSIGIVQKLEGGVWYVALPTNQENILERLQTQGATKALGKAGEPKTFARGELYDMQFGMTVQEKNNLRAAYRNLFNASQAIQTSEYYE